MSATTRHFLTIMGLTLLGLVAAGCELMQPQPAEPEPVHFTMGVEQDGQRIPVNGNTVRIRRAPFRLVFYFEQMGSMLAHASLTPEKVEALQAGKNVNALFMPGANVPEELFNPHRSMHLGDDAYHNWVYLGPETHRFDSGAVHKLGARGFICRRTVEKLVKVRNNEVQETIPISELEADRLYLSFVQTQRVAGASSHQELQRDWLIVEFVD